MKHSFRLSLLTLVLTLSGSLGMMADSGSRGYGIQVYSESMDPDDSQKLLSFPLDNLQDVTVEEDFGDSKVLTGAAHDGIYYILYTEDEVVPSKFGIYDMKRHKFTDVKTYNFTYDVAGSLMVLDMTYDLTSQRLYAVAADLGDGEIVGDEIDAPFGLYIFDPLTGDATLVGYQETAMLVGIAAGNSELWGVDAAGNVWIINKDNGQPEDIIYSTDIIPIGVQSMSYDFGNGIFYWASYTAGPEHNGLSELVALRANEDYEVEAEELGPIGDEIEVIGFYIDDKPVDPKAPRAVEGLSVTPDENGENEAILSWTNPEKSINGSDLTGTLTITIMRNDVKAGEVTGKPGEVMTWTDNLTVSAMCSYIVTAYIDGLAGTPVYAEPIFVGTDLPGVPTDVKAARNAGNNSITVTWTAPEVGANDGWFDKSKLHYNVIRYPDKKIIAENTVDLEVVDSDITVQAGYSYGVSASSGSEFGPEAVSNVIVCGPAIMPPYVMTLTPEDENLWTVVNGDGDEYTWYVYHGLWGGTSDPFFRYYPEESIDGEAEADDWIISPSFSLDSSKKYIVTYDLRLYGDWFLANTSLCIGKEPTPEAMTRELAHYDQELIMIEWVTHTIPFTVDDNGDFNFGFKICNRMPAQLYKFTLREVPDVELEAISLNGPQTLTLNQPFIYKTEVKNLGFNTVDNYVVTLKDSEGNRLAQQSVESPIAPGETTAVEIEWIPETAGKFIIYAELSAEGDADPANNISPKMTVDVVNEGTWVEVASTNYSTGREPFFTFHNYSASQSIYSADMINCNKDVELRALTYYIADFMTKAPLDCDIEIWLANTSEEAFTDFMFPESEFSKVFEGEMTISPEDEQLTIIFDTPFIYTGDNLAIFTRHKSEEHASIVFGCYYTQDSPYYTLEYFSDEEAFNFTQQMWLARELPALSLLVYDENSGVLALPAQSTSVSYSHANRTLTIDGEFKSCRVYNSTGLIVAAFNPGSDMTIPPSASGIGIVEVTTSNGKIVKKIAF